MRHESRILLIGILAVILILVLIIGRDPDRDDIVQLREFGGPARVVDGDSLEIGPRRVRLFGIDAPEIGQRCDDPAGRAFACGERARTALEDAIGGGVLRCASKGRDRFGRILARCRLPTGDDLGTRLVRAGWAVAYRGADGRSYRSAEAEAMRRRVGLWAGRFERPEAWRRDHAAP